MAHSTGWMLPAQDDSSRCRKDARARSVAVQRVFFEASAETGSDPAGASVPERHNRAVDPIPPMPVDRGTERRGDALTSRSPPAMTGSGRRIAAPPSPRSVARTPRGEAVRRRRGVETGAAETGDTTQAQAPALQSRSRTRTPGGGLFVRMLGRERHPGSCHFPTTIGRAGATLRSDSSNARRAWASGIVTLPDSSKRMGISIT